MLKIIKGITNTSGISTPYVLPQATSSALGGIKADEKTENETAEVKIDTTTGKLFAPAGGGGMENPMIADCDLIIGGVDGEPTRLGQDNFITAQSGDFYDQKQILTLGRHGLKWLRIADYRAVLIYGRNGTIDIAESSEEFTIPAIEGGGDNRIVFKNIFQISGQNLAGKQRGCILTSRPIGYGDFPQPYTIELGNDGQVLTSEKDNENNITGIAWKNLPTPTLDYENAVTLKDNTLETPVDVFPYTPLKNGIIKIFSDVDVTLETTDEVLPVTKDLITLTTENGDIRSLATQVNEGVEWTLVSALGEHVKIFFIPFK